MLVSVRSLGGLPVSVLCKPDDTVQSFKSKLVAAAIQFVSLEPWRPDSDEWGLQYRANKIERCDSTLRDS